jgi:3-oxoacyl-[acyl-carrier protein] reductase
MNVLITGACGGLGSALAKAMCEAGHDLVLTGRSRARLEDMARGLCGLNSGRRVLFVPADLEHPDAPGNIFAFCQEHRVLVDVLVNNAAIHGPIAHFEETGAQAWEKALRVDFLAPVALCRLFLPTMKARGFGRILNISGGGASGPRPRFSAYACAKTALVRFSETLAHELTQTNITVNCVAPGAMKTPLLAEILSAEEETVGMGELSAAKKVFATEKDAISLAVKLCLFLASERAEGISGKLVSAQWDHYENWPCHLKEIEMSDLYTLRRVTARDRGMSWGDR